jgi:hypothetical protein
VKLGLTLRGERGLRLSRNRVLRRIFGGSDEKLEKNP